MYPTSNHVPAHSNANHNVAYHNNSNQPLPNGNGHHHPHHHHHQHPPHPNGHSHEQPPAQPHRPPPPQAAALKERITVNAIPSVTIKGDEVIHGDARSSSIRSYTMLKVVGDGSFGTVWLCDWHEKLPPKTPLSAMQCNAMSRPEYAGRTLVAVKKMKKRWEGGWDECKKLKELESLRAIDYHPNIIPLYDFFLLPDTKELYFVFESMEGNLYQLIKSRRGRPLAGGLVSSIFRQVVAGLLHIHDSGYFHRDMKPENLLVTTTGLHDYRNLTPHASPPVEKDVVVIVKLADFGLARETRSSPPYTEYVSTRWYRAPEVLLRSRDYSNPVDMWALGTIMAELVNLRPLFPGQDEIDQVNKICAVLGDPADDYEIDPRGRRVGGGKWLKGIKLAQKVGFNFPKARPRNLAGYFEQHVHPKLVECIVDLLRYDPQDRLTSYQCMHHPYLQETMPLVDLPAPTLRYATSEPSVHAKAASHARHNGLAIQPSGSMPSVSPRDLPPSHTQTSVSHPNLPKPPFNGSPHLHADGIPVASASHRAAFYASTSSVTQSHPSRGTTDYGRPVDPTIVAPVPVYAVGNGSTSSWPDAHGAPMDVSSPQRLHAPDSPMAQDSSSSVRPQVPQVQVNGLDPQAPTNAGKTKFSFGRKFAGMFGGDKAHANGQVALPPVEENGAASSPTVHTLKRAKSGSLDGHTNPEAMLSPAELKKAQRKEADRIRQEAERQKRLLAEKRQQEQARAVMQKRRQMTNAGGVVDTHNVPLHFVHGPGQSAGDKEKQASFRNGQPDANLPSPSTTNFPERGVDGFLGPHEQQRWREEHHHRMAKARRRDWDDDHSMSSSDVQSVGRMSVISFATVDSDPGPPHLRHRPSLFGLDRMTSTSSLRTSFGDSDQFPQSVRSSNSLSLEQQLASEFRSRATMDTTSSPPPLNMLTLSPTQHRWDHAPKRESSLSPGFQRPTHIDLPPPRFPSHPLQPGQQSPYEFSGDLTAYPHSPGELPKSAINPIFKVPILPSGVAEMPSSPNALPPFSQLEAVAEGEYPPLSPMSFAGGDD